MTESLVRAFPVALHDDVTAVLGIMPSVRFPPINPFVVAVDGESITIPARIYNAEPAPGDESRLTATQLKVLDCIYSRHGDGLIRQRRIARVARSADTWVAPFVVELVGEYVVEIIREIAPALSDLTVPRSAQFTVYGKFVAENPRFFSRVQRRVISYWSCYYREQYPQYWSYPGAQLIQALRTAGNSFSDSALPELGPKNRESSGYPGNEMLSFSPTGR